MATIGAKAGTGKDVGRRIVKYKMLYLMLLPAVAVFIYF